MFHKKIAVLAALTVMAASALAKTPTIDDVKKALPDLPGVESVTATPIKGIYEVVGESNVLYVSEDLKYIFSGHLFDAEKKMSLTEPVVRKMQSRDIERQARLAESMKDTIKTALVANEGNFLKEVKGSGKDVLYMVTDIRCGFCNAMEKNLESMTDITIYRIPVAFLGPESVRLGNAALCAKDKLNAWKDLASKKVSVGKEVACQTPLQENTELMTTWGVKGTPTFFRADGQRWAQGLLSPALTKMFIEKGAYETAQAKEKEKK